MGTKILRNPALYTSPTYLDLVGRLAANTRRLRTERGWTQAEAADRSGMAMYVLQTVEGGRSNFTGTVVSRLCDGFQVDVRELFAPAPPIAKRRVGRPRKTASPGTSPVASESTAAPPSSAPWPTPSDDAPPSKDRATALKRPKRRSPAGSQKLPR